MLDRLAKAAEGVAEYDWPLHDDDSPADHVVTNWPEVVRAMLWEMRAVAEEKRIWPGSTVPLTARIDTILNEKPDKPTPFFGREVLEGDADQYTEFEVAQAMARAAESMGWKLGAITDGSYELLKATHEKPDG